MNLHLRPAKKSDSIGVNSRSFLLGRLPVAILPSFDYWISFRLDIYYSAEICMCKASKPLSCIALHVARIDACSLPMFVGPLNIGLEVVPRNGKKIEVFAR